MKLLNWIDFHSAVTATVILITVFVLFKLICKLIVWMFGEPEIIATPEAITKACAINHTRPIPTPKPVTKKSGHRPHRQHNMTLRQANMICTTISVANQTHEWRRDPLHCLPKRDRTHA